MILDKFRYGFRFKIDVADKLKNDKLLAWDMPGGCVCTMNLNKLL